jgi:hypothetical protein
LACASGVPALGVKRVPEPEHWTVGAPGSPGRNVSCGVAVTVTQSPPAHSVCVTTPVQLTTVTKTGTPMIDAVPAGGDDSTTG